MQLNIQRSWPGLVIGATLFSGSVGARANTVTFDVSNIDFHVTAVNGIPPVGGPRDFLGDAQFTWTYTPGDFANGSGVLNFVTNPFNGSPGGYLTADAVDLTGFSTTLASANVQNLSYDIAVNFAAGLVGPSNSTLVNGGSFDLTGTYPGQPHVGGEFTGSITSGSVVPAGSVATAPEPETYAMLLAGLALLGVEARRRKQQAA